MFDPMPNNSPFDINMALDAGFDVLMPYHNVKLEDVYALTQDAIFSRGPAGIKKTGIFIGGRDMGLAMDMIESAKQAMVPPFKISVLADPSGAFTTAAALVAAVEKILLNDFDQALKQSRVLVFGGTGPVGIATGVIASLAGSDTVLVDHLSLVAAKDVAKEYNRRCKSNLSAAVANSDQEKIDLVKEADIILCTAKAGIQVLSCEVLAYAKNLKVAGDVNAVPPAGLEGISATDKRVEMAIPQGAIGIGALTVGNIKYQLQHNLLSLTLKSDKPVYFDFRDAFTKARTLV